MTDQKVIIWTHDGTLRVFHPNYSAKSLRRRLEPVDGEEPWNLTAEVQDVLAEIETAEWLERLRIKVVPHGVSSQILDANVVPLDKVNRSHWAEVPGGISEG